MDKQNDTVQAAMLEAAEQKIAAFKENSFTPLTKEERDTAKDWADFASEQNASLIEALREARERFKTVGI